MTGFLRQMQSVSRTAVTWREGDQHSRKEETMKPEDRKATPEMAGFTLVELVVVIAILGILAGIGYVGYNGYIRYARRASDDEYIGAVNEAFAAACQERGIDHSKLGENAATVSFRDSSNKDSTKTKLITVALPNTTSNQEKAAKKRASVKDSFDRYFEGEQGNKEMVLKYYKADSIMFKGKGQLFVACDDAESVRNSVWEQSGFKNSPEHVKDVVQALNNFIKASGYKGELDGLTLEEALDKVDDFLTINDKEGIMKYFEGLGLTGQLDYEKFGAGFTAYIADASSNMSPEKRAELLEDIRSRDVEEIPGEYKNYRQVKYTDPLLEIPMQLAALEGYYNSGQASDGFKARFDKLRQGYLQNEDGKGGTAGLQGLLDMQSGGVSVFCPLGSDIPDSNELDKFREYKNSAQFDTDMNAYFDVLEQAAAKAADGVADGSLKPDDPSFLDSIFDFLG